MTFTEQNPHMNMPDPDEMLPPGVASIIAATDQPVSAVENPELATAMSQQAIEGEKPEAKEAPIGHVELPGGWFGPDGTLCTSALVRELTGRDEEKLARINPVTSYPQFLQTLVGAGLENINGHVLDVESAKSMLVGDREALILGIRIATYGPNLDMHLTCPACNHEEDLILELDKDIPIKAMDEPEVREYPVDLRNGRVAVVRPMTCGVADSTWDTKKTSAEVKTLRLARSVKEIDGRPVAQQDVLNLGLADRKALLERMAEIQPGPDYEGVRLPCVSCGEEFSLALTLADLFQ